MESMPGKIRSAARKLFDYIVVGAGAAGCIVAARLSENPNMKVLLVEAGGSDRRAKVRMPGALALALADLKLTWNFNTGPEPYLDGRCIEHARGKVVGGSASINGMVFVRGDPRDFDCWADSGLEDWSYEKCLPHFKNIEDFDGGSSEHRGTGGPIRVVTCKAELPIYRAFIEAGAQAGLEKIDDYNAGSLEGVFAFQANIDRGVRASSAWGYLRRAAGRENLTVLANAECRKIILDRRRAFAIEVVSSKGGDAHLFKSEREVVLCAGAYKTPQLLMLSGIGDKTELLAAGIEPALDAPAVGKYLEDHIAVSVGFRASQRGVSPQPAVNSMARVSAGARWLLTRTGPCAGNFFEVGAFYKSSEHVERADIQIEFIPVLGKFQDGMIKTAEGFQYQICLMRPRSKGHVKLTSADPRANPEIVHNYLADKLDRRDLVNAVRRAERIARQSAWDELRGESVDPDLRSLSDGEVESWLRRNIGTQYHPCGTCRMGAGMDSVVDGQGLVHEIDGLRIVDASIIPRITTGNLNAPVMMIAEKIAAKMTA